MDFLTKPRQFVSIRPNPEGGHATHVNRDELPLPLEMRRSMATTLSAALPVQRKKRERPSSTPEKGDEPQASSSIAQGAGQLHAVDKSGWKDDEHSKPTIMQKVMAAFGVDPGKQFKFTLEAAPVALEQAKQLLHSKKVIAVMKNGDAVVAKHAKYNKKVLPLELVVLTKNTIDALKREYEQLKVEEGKDSRLTAKRSKGLGSSAI
jgi:hypothetical protein